MDALLAKLCYGNLLNGAEPLRTIATLVLVSGQRVRARLVLGADGAASRVRELAGLSFDERDYRQRGVVAYVSTERTHENTAFVI